MHCNNFSRNVSKSYLGIGQSFIVFQHFTSVYKFNVTHWLWRNSFVCKCKGSIKRWDKYNVFFLTCTCKWSLLLNSQLELQDECLHPKCSYVICSEMKEIKISKEKRKIIDTWFEAVLTTYKLQLFG